MSKLTLKHEQINGIDSNCIVGHLLSYSVNLSVKMTAVVDRKSPDAPNWEVFTKAPHGQIVKIGCAKEHEITRGHNAGKVMLSIWFTDPEFEGVSFSAFPLDGQNGVWDAQTERKRKQTTTPAAQVEAAPVSDEIPFS